MDSVTSLEDVKQAALDYLRSVFNGFGVPDRSTLDAAVAIVLATA